MAKLFLKLLNMSVSASWLVLAVILLRLVLRKAPKWTHCLLWALVAVRLVCPFSLESSLSLIPAREEVTMESLRSTVEMEMHVAGTYVPTDTQASDAPSSVPESTQSTVKTDTRLTSTILPNLSAVWFAGMSLMLIYAFESYWRIRKKVDISIDLGGGICICDYISSPFILGILKPRICLPSSLSSVDAAHVLAHERAHLKRRDHWWKPLGYLLLSIYWFNPLIWVAYLLLCRDIELACDQRVVKDMAPLDKKAYSEALLNCSLPRHMIAACPLAFGEIGVKERVKSVLNYKKPAFWIIIVAVIACIVTAVCFLTDPKEPKEPISIISASIDQDSVQALEAQFPELKLFDWGTVSEALGATQLTLFAPQHWDNTLFVGCEYDDGYGLACLEQTQYGYYELKQVFTSREQLPTTDTKAAGFHYTTDQIDMMVYVCWNEEITAMEWTNGYWDQILLTNCPGLFLVDTTNWPEDYSGDAYSFRTESPVCISYELAEDLSSVSFSGGNSLYIFSSSAWYYENLPRPGLFSLTSEDLRELIDVLQSIPTDAMESGLITESSRLAITLTLDNGTSGTSDMVYLELRYDGSAVDLSLSVSENQPSFAFHISDQKLNAFLESLCDPNRIEQTIITYGGSDPIQFTCMYANMEVLPLLNWEYEIVGYTDDNTPFGIRGRPKYCEEGWVFLSFWPNGFQPQNENGYSFSECPDDSCWTYLRLANLPGDYVLLNEGADAWLKIHEGEVLSLVQDTDRLAVGILRLEETQKVAQILYPDIPVDSMRFAFDWRTGIWTIYPYSEDESFTIAATFDADGNIVSVPS